MSTYAQPVLTFFGMRLRRHRELMKMTQDQLGHAVFCSPSLVSMIETGQSTPQPDFARHCDKVLETGGLFTSIVEELLGVSLVDHWFTEWVAYEQRAIALRTYQPLLIPGLLQTPDYTRAVMRSSAAATAAEIERQVTARLARQETILKRDDPPLLIALLDEGILRRPIGGREVMLGQIKALADIADTPKVHIQVIPLDTGMYEGLRGPLVIAEFENGGEAAYVDTAYRGIVLERADDIATIKTVWESLRAEALPRKQSAKLIMEAMERWT